MSVVRKWWHAVTETHVRVIIRRDTRAEWQRINPVLRENEPGGEIDFGGVKIGNGRRRWNDLPYELPPNGGRSWVSEGLMIGRTRT